MTERVSAIPDHLLLCARATDPLVDDLRRVQHDVALAYAHARARCSRYAALDARAELAVGRAASLIDALAEMVHEVGAAFARAGAAGPDGVVRADADAIVTSGVGWQAKESLVAGEPGEWGAAVYGATCAGSATAFYGGGNGFIIGPDGRRYPLVAPSIVRGGKVFNAGDGVGDLGGLDPGWRVVDVETGIERHRAEPGFFERFLVGVGSTVSGPTHGSTTAEVESVLLRPGRPPALTAVGPSPLHPPPVPPAPTAEAPPLGAGASAVALAPFAADVAVGAFTAGDGAQHAYQVVFEQNGDGRRRATYLRVDVRPPRDEAEPWLLVPSYVVTPSVSDGLIPVRYNTPASITDPKVVVAQPPDDEPAAPR